ncbi:NINE protein [Cellulomonas sp. URHD0024]|uniref:NINE protein n=1 Tax=Cellulomonas sp. URHD0024 TaxID=1302620 RepID=UPI000420CDDD|nr:NINE protein [Cellulomonas sp. URHD0024]
MTDLIDRPADLDDDWFERPVVTRLPPQSPVDVVAPLSATVRYPLGRVPDLQDAPPAVAPRMPAARPARVWIRSRVAAGLLGVFLGGLGLHRMYLGYWRRGFTMLAVFFIGGLFTLGLATLVVCMVGFFEGLLYLSMHRGRFSRDARGRPLRG